MSGVVLTTTILLLLFATTTTADDGSTSYWRRSVIAGPTSPEWKVINDGSNFFTPLSFDAAIKAPTGNSVIGYDSHEDFLFLVDLDTKDATRMRDIACVNTDMTYLADGTTLVFLCGATSTADLVQVNTVSFHLTTLATHAISNSPLSVVLDPSSDLLYIASLTAIYLAPTDGNSPTLKAGHATDSGSADNPTGTSAKFSYILDMDALPI